VVRRAQTCVYVASMNKEQSRRAVLSEYDSWAKRGTSRLTTMLRPRRAARLFIADQLRCDLSDVLALAPSSSLGDITERELSPVAIEYLHDAQGACERFKKVRSTGVGDPLFCPGSLHPRHDCAAFRIVSPAAASLEGPSIKSTRFGEKLHEVNKQDVARYSKLNDFIARWFGSKDVRYLEKIATAYFISAKHYREPVTIRAKRLVTLKPHVDLASAEEALRLRIGKLPFSSATRLVFPITKVQVSARPGRAPETSPLSPL